MIELDTPMPASVRTVRAKLAALESHLRHALRTLPITANVDEAVNSLSWALDDLKDANAWLDHCADR